MQGPESVDFYVGESEHDGMIPLAVRQIFDTAEQLKTRGWLVYFAESGHIWIVFIIWLLLQYEFEVSYLEIYNEKIRDLLCDESNEDQN